MNLEKKLEKIEKQLDEMSKSRFPYSDPRIFGLQNPAASGDEIDLRELWDALWNGKWIIIGITFLFAIASVIFALSLPNIYKSEALLAPAEENSGGGLSRMAGCLGGLASLAGVDLVGAKADKTTIAVEILKSREFISKFVRKHKILIPLMAVKGWDRTQDTLIIDNNIYDEKSRKWVRAPKPPREAEPSALEAYEKFINLMSISVDENTGLVNLSVEHYSPYLAKEWVDLLILDINEEIKSRDVAEANKSIAFLSGQLEKTALAELKVVFYELIEEQTKTVMFAKVRDEYVFKTIDDAVVPELKVKPRRAFLVIAITFLGGVLGLVVVLIRYLIGGGRER
ncbi:Wzz/FepE/Etk N-terminal domain-containing protein [Teredinibacter turnerae]|uniref:Wzz/FepE/Etk N-terminal domain-containing protein n=1 Tax=Teredinibacter turnerae TaxID=2426 RepID=UPI000377B805|nr:Wzz/FepE/Etk N-terminal domain-containing protein [Teredinibacter turnerae]